MELLFALAVACVGILIIWKLLKGIARTFGLLIVAGLLAFVAISNGGFS